MRITQKAFAEKHQKTKDKRRTTKDKHDVMDDERAILTEWTGLEEESTDK
jgi:hypothetical protein